MNISFEPLVNPQDVYLHPLYFQLGLMKIFVKALDTEWHTFAYFSNKFPKLSEAKGEVESLLVHRWEVIQEMDFHSTLSITEKAAWNAVKTMCTNFLGNHKAENCTEIVSEMLYSFSNLWSAACN